MKLKLVAIALLVGLTSAAVVQACTSVAWNTDQGTFTSRTNDWIESTQPTLGGIKKGGVRYRVDTHPKPRNRRQYF